MLQIGLVAGVVGRDRGNMVLLRQRQRGLSEQVGHCEMDDVGRKIQQPPLRSARQAKGQAIFRPAGQGDRRHRHQRALMGKSCLPCDGRKDQNLDALAFQISDQTVQGQRHAVGDEIV